MAELEIPEETAVHVRWVGFEWGPSFETWNFMTWKAEWLWNTPRDVRWGFTRKHALRRIQKVIVRERLKQQRDDVVTLQVGVKP